MKKRIIVVLALVMLLFGSTVFGYSVWDNLQQTENPVITVGNGTTLTVSAVANTGDGKVLVPAGVVLKTNDVDEVVLTYNVKLDATAQTPLNLSVAESNVLINGAATYAGLVNIGITQGSPTVNDADVLVTVTVSLTEPTTQAEYDAIVGQQITFTLTFTGTVA